MKNLSHILNGILALAVLVLYYLHFSATTEAAINAPIETSITTNDTTIVYPIAHAKDIRPSQIVYINADTLLEKYEYLKVLKKETEAKHSKLEGDYTMKAKKFQEDYLAYQQKANQGAVTADQAKGIEEDLMKRKTELDLMEQQLNEILEEAQKKNSIAQRNVTDFLKEYNKSTNYNYVLAYTSNGGSVLFAKDSLDITKEVIEGLNARYKAKK